MDHWPIREADMARPPPPLDFSQMTQLGGRIIRKFGVRCPSGEPIPTAGKMLPGVF